MTNYLMNLELVSGAARRMKEESPQPNPYKLMATQGFHPEFQLNPEFGAQIASILAGSVYRAVRGKLDGPVLRENAISIAACRKAMSFISDPWTFMCVPPVGINDCFLTLFVAMVREKVQAVDPDDPTMLFPGLSYEGALRVLLHYVASDTFEDNGGATMTTDLFSELVCRAKTSPSSWNGFTVARRAALCSEIRTQLMVKGGKEQNTELLQEITFSYESGY